MLIRLANDGDAEAIATIQVRSWQTAYRKIVPQSYLDSLSVGAVIPKWEKRIHQMTIPYSFVYVTEHSNQGVIGYAWAGTPNQKSEQYGGEMHAIYLLPEYWRQGIGTQLFQRIKQTFCEVGVTSMILWALSENSACKFYLKQGGLPQFTKFEETGGVELEESGFVWDQL